MKKYTGSPPDDTLLPLIPAALEYLNISSATARRLAASGGIATVRVGRSIKVRRSTLERMIAGEAA